MYNITWDIETGGVALHSRRVEGTLGTSPRPVFWEELDLLKLNALGWTYPHCEAPLLWAVNKQYWYRGELVFEAKGASIYHDATIVFRPGKERLNLQPVDMEKMLKRCNEYMFLLESGAIEYGADVVFGLQLRIIEENEAFSKDKDIKEKRRLINEAKSSNPREVQLVCLKNRNGKSYFKCYFNYYPILNTFRAVTENGDDYFSRR